ncbi:Uncharacterised protein [Dermatophilus congolensis]|uniref:Uncharacterized protein n=1 Tax=Dermatophilus congolensis TaxID=1863 RepID=A0AA46BMS1_9MICO|nr:Uncharacterised protein [Dermatophilus congolensis]
MAVAWSVPQGAVEVVGEWRVIVPLVLCRQLFDQSCRPGAWHLTPVRSTTIEVT